MDIYSLIVFVSSLLQSIGKVKLSSCELLSLKMCGHRKSIIFTQMKIGEITGYRHKYCPLGLDSTPGNHGFPTDSL